jgi:hypothetical protein
MVNESLTLRGVVEDGGEEIDFVKIHFEFHESLDAEQRKGFITGLGKMIAEEI